MWRTSEISSPKKKKTREKSDKVLTSCIKMATAFVAYLKANIQRDIDCLKELNAVVESDYTQWLKLIQKIAAPAASEAAALSTKPSPAKEDSAFSPTKSNWGHQQAAKEEVEVKSPTKPTWQRDEKKEEAEVRSPTKPTWQQQQRDEKKIAVDKKPTLTEAKPSLQNLQKEESEDSTVLSTDALPQRTSPILKHLHHVASPSLRRQQSSSSSMTSVAPSSAAEMPLSRATSAAVSKPSVVTTATSSALSSQPSSATSDTVKVASKFGTVSFKSPPTHVEKASPLNVETTVEKQNADMHPTTPSRTTKPALVSEFGQKLQDGPKSEKPAAASPGPNTPPSALANLIQKAHQQAQETQHVIPKPAPSH